MYASIPFSSGWLLRQWSVSFMSSLAVETISLLFPGSTLREGFSAAAAIENRTEE
jgi:hypothetical protein